MYKMFFPSGNAEEFCDHVFRTFDMDKNGYIDFKVSTLYCVSVWNLNVSVFLLWRRLVWYFGSIVLEEPSTATSLPEDGSSRFLRSVGTKQTTRRHILEDVSCYCRVLWCQRFGRTIFLPRWQAAGLSGTSVPLYQTTRCQSNLDTTVRRQFSCMKFFFECLRTQCWICCPSKAHSTHRQRLPSAEVSALVRAEYQFWCMRCAVVSVCASCEC
jgi:hypothetical protein